MAAFPLLAASLTDDPLPIAAAAAAQIAITPGIRFRVTWLVRHRVLRTLALTVAAVAAADSAWFAIFVLYVEDVLDLPVLAYGVLLATGALGGLAGVALADRLVRGTRHRTVLAWSIAITAGAPVLLLAAPETWAAVVVVALTSGSFGVLNVAAVSLRQRLVPEGLLWLAAGYGLHAPFVLSGIVAMAATAAWLQTPPSSAVST